MPIPASCCSANQGENFSNVPCPAAKTESCNLSGTHTFRCGNSPNHRMKAVPVNSDVITKSPNAEMTSFRHHSMRRPSPPTPRRGSCKLLTCAPPRSDRRDRRFRRLCCRHTITQAVAIPTDTTAVYTLRAPHQVNRPMLPQDELSSEPSRAV